MIKTACHIHSEWSYDGKWSLRELTSEFTRRGYDVVMLTEHDRGFDEDRFEAFRNACAEAGTDELLLIPGIEYSDVDNIVHILTWGSVPFLGEGTPTTDLLKAIKAANGIAVLAHPSRRDAWRKFDPEWTEYLLGIESWNRKTDGWAPSKTAAPLIRGTHLIPFVGLDFHNRNQLFPMSMELDLTVEVSEQSVIDCMRLGQCRASIFGRSVESIGNGFSGSTLAMAEECRRVATRMGRYIGINRRRRNQGCGKTAMSFRHLRRDKR